MCAVAVDVAHELFQSVLGVEHLLLGLAFFIWAHVAQRDGDAGIQISQLAHALGDDVVLVFSGGEDGVVGPELLSCASQFGLSNHLDRVERDAALVFLLIDFAVAVNLREHSCGERIDAADAHAVQTAAHLVAAFVELTAGMEHRHDHLEGRLVHLLVLVHGNAAAVVLHGDGVVLVDGDLDVGAKARHRFVY